MENSRTDRRGTRRPISRYTAGTHEVSFKGPDGKTVVGTGKYLCVWRKQSDGKWKAVHDMWSTVSK